MNKTSETKSSQPTPGPWKQKAGPETYEKGEL